jgi:hypothetical protein
MLHQRDPKEKPRRSGASHWELVRVDDQCKSYPGRRPSSTRARTLHLNRPYFQ